MTIEIIKLTSIIDDSINYVISIDGLYEEFFKTYEEAQDYYKLLIENNGKKYKKEILNSVQC